MLWFFDRGAEVLEIETRYDNDTSEYVLEVRAPIYAPTTERFTDAVTFQSRLLEIEQGLSGQRWRRSGPPVMLPDGWPDRTPSQ
jgi:hypothetical protein